MAWFPALSRGFGSGVTAGKMAGVRPKHDAHTSTQHKVVQTGIAVFDMEKA
jgi:hypothetical protein